MKNPFKGHDCYRHAKYVECVSCSRLPTHTHLVSFPPALNVSWLLSTRVQLLEENELPTSQESQQSRLPRAQGVSSCGLFEGGCRCLQGAWNDIPGPLDYVFLWEFVSISVAWCSKSRCSVQCSKHAAPPPTFT